MRRHPGPAAACVLAAAAWSGACRAAPLELVREGRSRFVIVVPDSARAWESRAGEELARVLEAAAGARLPIVSESDFGGGPALFVGRTRGAADSGIVPETLHPDGFVLRRRGDTLFIAGREPWGTAYGAAAFLEEACGARWFFPGALGEEIPQASVVSVDVLDRVEEPDFDVRDFAYAQVWGPDGEERRAEFLDWAWHNRVTVQGDSMNRWGGQERQPGHAFRALFPPESRAALPDSFFALVDGRRMRSEGRNNWQPCLSYPPLIEEVARRAREAAARGGASSVFSLSPNDLGNFCQCGRCRALEDAEPREVSDRVEAEVRARAGRERGPARRGDGGEHTGPVFYFVAEVARRAPGVRFGCYAYDGYRRPPATRPLPDNVEIWHCQFAGDFADPAAKEREGRRLTAWRDKGVPLYVYEYYGHYRARVPRLFPDLIAEELRDVRALGVRGVHSESSADWALHGLNYWVAARMLWDTSGQVTDLLDQYARGLFGPAARPMGRYFDGLREAWRRGANARSLASPAMLDVAMGPFDEARVEGLEAELSEAGNLAAGKIRERVEFFAKGLFYPRLYLDGQRVSERLRRDRERMALYVVEDARSPDAREVVERLPSALDAAAISEAEELRRRETQFLESLTGTNALPRVSIEVTEREYHSAMAATSVPYLAWKYWSGGPAGEAGENVKVDAAAHRRAAERLRELTGGSNLARREGLQAGSDGNPRGRGWRSAEEDIVFARGKTWADCPPRWVELAWPAPTALEAVVIHWEEDGAYWTPRAFELQAWTGAGWQTLARVKGNGECRETAVLFPRRETRRLRLWQAGDGGPALRPNLLAVREIECYGAP